MIIIQGLTALGSQGAVWGTESEDLDATLVRWEEGRGVTAHIGKEVDVVMVVLAGTGIVRVDSESQGAAAGTVIVIPKGSEREVRAGQGGLTYVNVHKRKRKMLPNMVRPGR